MTRRWTLALLAATGLVGAPVAVSAETVVLFPLQRGTRDVGSAAVVVEQALYDGLRELGDVADPGETRNALRRLRLRSPERAGADQLRRLGSELDAAWLFAAVLHDAPARQVPDLSISARLYDGASGEIVWAGFAAASGLDSRSVLGLGVRERVEALAPMPVRRLLAASPLAGNSTTIRPRLARPPAGQAPPMALVPFTAYVESDALAAAVTATEAARAALYPDVTRLASPECVEAALASQKSLAWGELSAEARAAIRDACRVDLLVTGSVERWEVTGPAAEPRPVVALALRLLDAASGRILWMGSREATGWDSQGLFGLGRVHSRGALLERLLARLSRDLLLAAGEVSPAAADEIRLALSTRPTETQQIGGDQPVARTAEAPSPVGGAAAAEPAPEAPPEPEAVLVAAPQPVVAAADESPGESDSVPVISPGTEAAPVQVGESFVETVDESLDEIAEARPPAAGASPPAALALVEGARSWLGRGIRYDTGYVEMAYPGGDPPADRGAAVDLVVRAFRQIGIDLQRAIHEDILDDRAAYGYERREPDTNVSHRRIRNLVVFLSRNAETVSLDDYRAGDVVLWDTDGSGDADHIGVVSSGRAIDGEPMVVHHRRPGSGFRGVPSEDDVLERWPVAAHFRIASPAAQALEADAEPQAATQPAGGLPRAPVEVAPAPEPAPAPVETPAPPAPAAARRLAPPAAAGPITGPGASKTALDLVEGARGWVGRGVRYDSSYFEMDYPGGDPPADRGAAVDLVVRAFRQAGIDLQQAIHEDIARDLAAYGYGDRQPDTNVSHRRIANLLVYFARKEATVEDAGYRPGDVVLWDTDSDGRADHIGIVSTGRTTDGRPLVIHHRRPDAEFTGQPAEDDALERWPIAAHFRHNPHGNATQETD